MKIRLSIDAGTGTAMRFEHAGPLICIGREAGCELLLDGKASDLVSRRHARIELAPSGATIVDLGSSNGTFLNGQLLDAPSALHVGDRIRMGFTGATLTVQALELAGEPVADRVGSRQKLLTGAVAVALSVLVLVAAILYLTHKDSEVAQAGSSTSAATQPSTTESALTRGVIPPVVPPPVLLDVGLNKPPVVPDPIHAPKEEIKEIATYRVLKDWWSVLLQRQGANYPWTVVRPESRVSTAQTLVSLPGYRSLLTIDSRVDLTLFGNLPEFSTPLILESAVMLNAPAQGTDLDFTLDRGRAVVVNRKQPPAPARVCVRFLHEAWDVELPENGSEVAVELWSLPEKKKTEPLTATYPTCFGLFVKKGAVVRAGGETFALRENSRLSWANRGNGRPSQVDLPGPPELWKDPDRNVPEVRKALATLVDWSQYLNGPDPMPGQAPAPSTFASVKEAMKNPIENLKDPDYQDLGILFLAALDEVGPLVTFLKDRQDLSGHVRGTALFALQGWLGRGSSHALELVQALGRDNSSETAERIVRLMFFHPPEELRERKTYEDLVHQLDDGDWLVRELAHKQLVQLGAGGYLPEEAKHLLSKPLETAEEHRAALEQWKKLLAEGKLPVSTPPR